MKSRRDAQRAVVFGALLAVLIAAPGVAEGRSGDVRRRAPEVKPPPPTAAQVRGLGMLEAEAREYTSGARDFRRHLVTIVRHHYAEKRQRVLTRLDREIRAEKERLRDARDRAIRRLEVFVARYDGTNAHPVQTPDAMFRLAALYEERGRESMTADLDRALEPSIDLYRRILREFPTYPERGAVLYYLGHAYYDGGRLESAQQVWRALACANRYAVRDSSAEGDDVELQPLEQAPYPSDCRPAAPVGDPDQRRYVAEAYWKLGDHHFDEIDARGGPYELNRAVSAYDHALRFAKSPLYGVVLYKRAWALYKQQRYRAAIAGFVDLLRYADEQERATGDPGADFRSEAYTYIAGSLTFVDLDGPEPDAPRAFRPDVLDSETDPSEAARKMAVALERVEDPTLIPQDATWTNEIVKALGREFVEIGQYGNAVAAFELALKKKPLDREAPEARTRIAELHDRLAQLAPRGSSDRARHARSALEHRTALSAYVGVSEWTDAHRDDPAALLRAEELVRDALRSAAAERTNRARAAVEKAKTVADEASRRPFVDEALADYRLAARAWRAYSDQDGIDPVERYEAQYWLADARYWSVALTVALGRSPSGREIRSARAAAEAVRDSNAGDDYLQPAAFYLVAISETVLDDLHRQHEASGGARGIARRDELPTSGNGSQASFTREAIPEPVRDAIAARDSYTARIARDRDPENNGTLYELQAADYFFVYGHLDEAERRFAELVRTSCGRDDRAHAAWKKLVTIAGLRGDRSAAVALVSGRDCTIGVESRRERKELAKRVRATLEYEEAGEAFEKAERVGEGAGTESSWRRAAKAYERVLRQKPDAARGVEAATNAAYAHRRLGEHARAGELYQWLIDRYGSEEQLSALQKKDPEAYRVRVSRVRAAFEGRAAAAVGAFDYPGAARAYEAMATNPRFAGSSRKDAARRAATLFAKIGSSRDAGAARDTMKRLGATRAEMAEIDFVLAKAEHARSLDATGTDREVRAARRRALRSMREYYRRYRKLDSAARRTVEAAFHGAALSAALGTGDVTRWRRRTLAAFERWRGLAPKTDGRSSALGSAEASMAAEAELALLDSEIRRTFDHSTGHHRFRGRPKKILDDFEKAAKRARVLDKKLEHVVSGYLSQEWSAAAYARRGTLFDSIRTGLYGVRPPALEMMTRAEQRLVERLEQSGDPELEERADDFRTKKALAWKSAKQKRLDSADAALVQRYATAVMLSQRYGVSSPFVDDAIRRLATLAPIIGEKKMREYAGAVPGLAYEPGLFTRRWPGLVAEPPSTGAGPPLPVAPSASGKRTK